MKLAASLSKLFAAVRGAATAARSATAAAPAPLIVALEPRIVYDASVATIGAAAAVAQHPANLDAHATSAAHEAMSATTARHGYMTTPFSGTPSDTTGARAVHGFTESAAQSADRQVVFVNSNVTDYQTLTAGLPQGTQVVILDASKDGLAQIEQYLQQHPGVSAIHLVSHGSDGNVQVGSTWLNEGDLSAYSGELAQIGAAMKSGGDFLIYGCDVAQNADGKALVQQIASITGLNVAASTDATGTAALGGDWTLEYDAGAVHTQVIFSQAAEQQYGALLGVTDETYDTQVGYVTPGGATGVTSFTLDGITYTLDQASEFAVDSTTVNQFGPPPLSTGPSDGVLFGNVQGGSLHSMTMTLANNDKMAVQSFDIDINAPSVVAVEALDGSGNVVGTVTLDTSANGGSSVFHVNLASNASFSGIKSLKFIETDSAFLTPTLNNFSYVDLSSPPALTATGGSTSFVEADNVASTPVAIDSGITLSDGDATTARQGTVSITGNFSSGQDVLAFNNNNSALYGDISASYSATSGVLTLTSASGTASIAQWQSAFRSVTYTDTAVTPSTSTRTVSFELTSDAYLSSSSTVTKNVTVTATDQSPIVSTAGSTVAYRDGASAVTIDGAVTVSDLDNTTQSSGTVSISGGFHSGDTLAFTNTSAATFGNIAASYNAATGVLTLTSAGAIATDAQWQHALSAVTFFSSSTTLGNRTIAFATSDGTKTSTAVTDTVSVLTPVQITTDSGSAAFVAGDNTASTPVAIDSGLTVTDTAATTLGSATVAITGGFHSGEDVLALTNDGSTMGNITSSYDAATGVLTLTSASASATLAQWQSALQSVMYTDTLVTPNNTTRTVSFTAVDGAGNTSATATRTVTVADTDQTPIITTTGGTTSYVGASSPVTIDGHVTVSDRDNSTQTSATVAITAGFHSGDVLSFTNDGATMGNIAASYSAGSGVLLLTSVGGSATNAQWASALSAVTFSSASTTYGNRTILFQVNDGTKNSSQVADTINMTAPPTITTDSGSASFVAGDNVTSTPVAIDSGLTVTDGSASTLSTATVVITGGFHSGDVLSFTNDGATMGNITSSYNAATGVMTLSSASASATLAQWQSALQSVSYTDTLITPNSATRTISFTAVDGAGNTSATATRTVTVTDTDQTPVVSTTGGTTNYVGGTSAATIDGGVTVSDLDNTTQSSGTVSVTSGFHTGDTLTFINSSSTTFGNIVGSYNAATGVLTLTSSGATASDAQWANALSAVTFSAGSSATPGNRTISFTVSDGTKTSAARTDTVDVLGPPTITTDSGSAAFVAGDNATSSPVTIDPGLTLTDGVSPTLASATVAITGGFHSAEDVLGFANTNATAFGNVAGSYNAATGVLTLTSSGASATLAQWQAALEAVTYTDTAVTPDNTTRTISFTAVDTSAVTSNTATRTVTVTDTDQTPIVSVLGGTTNYVAGTSAVAIDGAITVSDRDNTTQSVGTVAIGSGFHVGDTLTFINTSSATFGNIVGSYNAATGVLTLTSSGAVASDAQWSHALSAVTFSTSSSATPGNRTIAFTVNDGTKTSAAGNDTIDVLGPPTITVDAGSASFVAGDNATSTPVAIDSGLSVTDGSSSTLASATVAITGGFHSGEDVLAFANTNSSTYGNIAASYNATTGVLTLTSASSTATLAQWQAALDAVTYTDTAITPNTATRTISFTAVDTGAVTSNTATRTVSVTDTDQTPIVTAAGGSASYVAGAAATVVNPSVSVTDLDNATQSSATVSITSNFHSGEDVLAFTNGNATTFGNIAATYNSTTGVMTLSSAGATATDAQWANALSAVTFSSSGTHFGNRAISFATSDGSKTSAAVNATLVVLDQPHVAPDNGPASFVAADNATSTPIVVSPGLTLTDASSTTASSASVAITGGFHSGEDVLAFTNDNATMGNIAATYNASTGVMTLTSAGGTASLAQWRAALASITYTDTAVIPDTTTRVISFTVTDGNGTASATQTRNVAVTDTDQTPLLAVGGSVTFTSLGAHSTPVTVAPEVTISDRNPNASLSSAQVTISGGFDAANDTLAFSGSAATGNIAASYNAATGVLTLTSAGGAASLAQWQAAVQSITYSDSKAGASGSRTLAFSVSDGVKTSAIASNTVTLVSGQVGIVPVFPTPPTVIESPAAEPSSLTNSDHNGAPVVLDEFDQPLPVGSVPIVPTITFSDPSAPRNTQPLDRTSVPRFDATALDATMSVAALEAPVPLPDVSFAMGPNDPFSIEVATLLPPSAAMQGSSDVTVRLANGRSLPGWIHYDAASGVLRGKLPAGAQDVHIVVEARDASGHQTRREIVLVPHDQHGSSHHKHDLQHGQDPHGVAHAPPQGHAARAHAEPSIARAVRSTGKPSLDQQFAQARAALHVSHPGGATRRV